MRLYYKGMLINPSVESDTNVICNYRITGNSVDITLTKELNRRLSNDYDMDNFKRSLSLNLRNAIYYDDMAEFDSDFDDNVFTFVVSHLFSYDLFTYFYNSNCNYLIKEIIYEIVEDENKNQYGRELKTGLLFPLFNKDNFNSSSCIYRRKDVGKGYYELSVNTKPKITMECMGSVSAAILNNRYASSEDIESYSVSKELIEKYYKKNVFKRKVNIIEKPDIDISEEIRLINNINFYLELLKDISEEKYNELNAEYNSILSFYNDKSLNNIVDKSNLIKLLNDIKFYVYFYVDGSNYPALDKLKNDKNYTLNDLDNLLDVFLTHADIVPMINEKEIIDYLCELFIILVNQDNKSYSYKTTKFNELKRNILSVLSRISNYELKEKDCNLELESISEIIAEVDLSSNKEIKMKKKFRFF